MTDIGTTIKHLRMGHGWGQEVFGYKAGGLSKQSIGEIERGRRMPNEAVLQQIATAFGIGLDTLLAGAEDEINALWRFLEIAGEVRSILEVLAPADREAVLEYAQSLRDKQAPAQ